MSLKYLKATRAMKTLKHMVLFMVTAPYTCEYVSEIFFFFFFAAKVREDTSSLALDANGVITNDTKKAGRVVALANALTAST